MVKSNALWNMISLFDFWVTFKFLLINNWKKQQQQKEANTLKSFVCSKKKQQVRVFGNSRYGTLLYGRRRGESGEEFCVLAWGTQLFGDSAHERGGLPLFVYDQSQRGYSLLRVRE